MTGKMPRSPQYAPDQNSDAYREFLERSQRQAAMNMRRDEWGVMNVYAALNTPKPRTNAIGIPLIKCSNRDSIDA